MPEDDRLAEALAAIDAANADDPNRLVVRGVERPKELAHAELVTEWVERLRPDPPVALRLAARAHHLRRWTIPRSSYPDGRGGYLRWKRDLQIQHAEDVGRILGHAGYDPETIDRVQAIIRKRGLGRDEDVQAFEDALCLAFVETQLADLATKLEREHMVEVVRKTLQKMSEPACRAALSIPLPAEARALLDDALA